MRVGLISDIHGNRLALDAVVAELEKEDLDQIVCLGDVAVGPQPAEALAGIRELGCRNVMGNWDACFLDGMPEAKDEVGQKLVDTGEWWAQFLSDEDREFMRELRADHHDRPRRPRGALLPRLAALVRRLDFRDRPPTTSFERCSTGTWQPALVGGHTHLQLVRRFEKSILVNPGSVGLPFVEWWPRPVRIAPWAEYGILSSRDGRLEVELRRTTFDVEAFLTLSRSSGMPHADWWADCWERP